MLKLVEFFHSIQGEGKFAGKNAIFFRFAGCNLRCAGFGVKLNSLKTGEVLTGCDTIRAVYTNHFEYENITSKEALLSKFEELDLQNAKPIIVITGGEPLLHHKDEIFYAFISEVLARGFEVHFETNGSVEVDFARFNEYKKCVFCISPKLSNSGEKREKRLNFKALNLIKENAKDSFYKFVISSEFNLQSEILDITQAAPNEVFCMPLGKNKKELEKNAKFTFEFCLKNGYNYTDRLHIRIFDDKDGI
ncbi:7-carboxy-7-deazaguanine synthase QueE [Campylobacter geochelonis]|uniref:7-carboxy-7-deazaguanine synthase QueE n=1 Tax=Campylobacter geochelonis TaxID=1780362 RepID=UPI00077079DF|nr:7-carboxy-7-deazaguanine synthase QueE [Campylobacter geochelonis]CZE46593.1 radical SAM domain-containing protein [Campylobacter geochelonis]